MKHEHRVHPRVTGWIRSALLGIMLVAIFAYTVLTAIWNNG